MKPLFALATAIGVLAVAATWLSLSCNLLVWALFIGWGSFFTAGGDNNALKTSILNNLFGIIVGWVTALLILTVPVLGLVPRASIIVGITCFALVLAAHIKALSAVPNGVFGYAALFGYVLLAKDAMSTQSLLSLNLKNGLLLVAVSMLIGNIFGIASAKVSAALQPKPAAEKAKAAAA